MSVALGQEALAEMTRTSRLVSLSILVVVLVYLALLTGGFISTGHAPEEGHAAPVTFVPSLWAVLPFAGLLLAIAVLPLIRATQHWWHSNTHKFLVALVLSGITLAYYGLVHPGGIADHFSHGAASNPGLDTVRAVFDNAILAEFIPFIVLLFSLYVISGGINLSGDLPAHTGVNAAFLGLGAILASFIGTTGAAMMLVRPLLATNAERKHRVHTVVFFIFIVCNCGGLLLPIGDPPLFLGYLRGVPFTWTLKLWPYWLAVNGTLLVIYCIWDRIMHRREPVRALISDETQVRPLRVTGLVNIPLILGVVTAVAFLVPGKPFLGTAFIPPVFFREVVMLMLVVLSLHVTRPETRRLNRFDYTAILEVAALFSGIFICMQVPIEILHARGASLGLDTPFAFFWATGALSSFLDNAPTYVVFFETAATLPAAGALVQLAGGREILEAFLIAVSLGAVFMGANTYIGNGPNFMVKTIAEQSGIRMPSFFGYMGYALAVLVPLWIALSFLL
jgi:Na+/H+ antiporter NhaD/arsenite permease-like protein